MTKERQIAEDIILNNYSYRAAAKKYSVSYNQIAVICKNYINMKLLIEKQERLKEESKHDEMIATQQCRYKDLWINATECEVVGDYHRTNKQR